MHTKTIDKIATFNLEYTYINNPKYKNSLKVMVNLLPDYFFEVPASSTGKYHPTYALGSGGLIRHTKAVVRIAQELYQNETITGKFSKDEKDLMLVAMVLHDGLKAGLTPDVKHYTKVEHPLLMAEYIEKNKEKLEFTEKEIDFLKHIISTHMGEWNKDWNGLEVLPLPVDKYQRFVHMCDYLASRKIIELKFEQNEIIS